MFNGNYIKIDTILNDISQYPFVEKLTKRDASHHLVKVLGLMGTTLPLERRYEIIQIKTHKGELPSDIVYLHGVNNKGDNPDNEGYVMKYASDIYHSVLHSDEAKANCKTGTTPEVTPGDTKEVGEVGEIEAPLWYAKKVEDVYDENSYVINGMSIDVSFANGYVEIAYDGIKMDPEGFPMIPDDPAFREAFKYFLLKQSAEPNFYRGTVNERVYRDIEQKYYAYIAAASNRFNMPSLDQMESIRNTLIRILPNQHQHKDGWRSANRPKS